MTRSTKIRAGLVAWVAFLAVNAAAADRGPAWLPDVPDRWTKITPGPVTVDGKRYAPTCSGFPGTDATFHFWAKRGTADGVVVFFEGGGACWDDLTCTFPIAGLPAQVPQFYVPGSNPNDDPTGFAGVFDLANPANPVKDWTFVYIPYCTADVHRGSATRSYTSVGHPVLPLPAGTRFTIQHRGFDNFMAVLDWMRRRIESPNRILVTGSSAGAYGAVGNFPWIGEAYPRAHLSVVGDAGQGVTTVAWDHGTPGRGSWNMVWPWPDAGALRTWEVAADNAEHYPHAKVAQFTTQLDAVQDGFYSLMKAYYGPGGACPSASGDWSRQMVGALRATADETDNFRYYVAAGTYHTIMRSPTFYTEASAGLPFAEWLGAMVRNQGGTGGHGGVPWANVACPGCLDPAPCP